MIQNPLPHDHGQTIEQELEHMPSVENFQTVADIFKQLGDGSRIRIFWLLCHCEECVINLSAMVNMRRMKLCDGILSLPNVGEFRNLFRRLLTIRQAQQHSQQGLPQLLR